MKTLTRSLSLLTLMLGLSWQSAAFAQPPSLEALGRPGPYQVAYYDQLPERSEFASGTLYFPANRGGSFAGVAIAPGFSETQDNVAWWGRHLSSHGYAVLVLDTNSPQEDPALRAEALLAALEVIRSEGERMGSPIRGKVLAEQMAVMGHSMGGGGALLAANAGDERIRAVIPFTPWQPQGVFDEVSAATLVIAGEADRIASVGEHAWSHYESLPATTPRMYIEVATGNHFIANSVTEDEGFRPNIAVADLLGGLGVAWLKLYLDGDESYRELVYSEFPGIQRARLSRREFSQ